MKIKVQDGVVVAQDYSLARLKADHPDTSFLAEPTTAMFESWGVFDVQATQPPAFDPMTQVREEATPALVNGAWVQQWTVRAATTEEANARAAALQADVVEATQERLDTFAQTRGYDGILSAATYATSGVTKFAQEGQYCVDARDATWSTLYTVLAEVQAGTRPMPAGYAEIEPLLPALVWPA